MSPGGASFIGCGKTRADRSLWSRLRIGVTGNQLLAEPRPQGAIIRSHFFRTLLGMQRRLQAALLFLFAVSATAQQYEVGATVGYGFYRDGTIFSASGTADAGIRNRFAAGILLGDEFSKYVSAEFDYLYHDGHPFLEAPGVKSDIQGNSDALTIQLLFHFKTREHRWRPFLAGGTGAKEYVIAGPSPFPQPIPEIASLTTNDVWKVVFTAGGGVKVRLIPHMLLRAEFRDYITTFPRQQIVPAPHNTARGIFEQFTPLVGVSYTFR